MTPTLSSGVIEAIVAGRHGDPFAVLGLHEEAGKPVIRAFVPGAESVEALTRRGEPLGQLACLHGGGFFAGGIARRERYLLRARRGSDTWTIDDSYAYGPVLGTLDDWLLGEGTHTALYERLGAHTMVHEETAGAHFAVWAPNAQRVSLVGDFNAWDGRRHAMRRRVDTGTWEIFVPGLGEGALYKYEIVGPDGVLLPLKADPVGFGMQLRPGNASVVHDISSFAWTDGDWLAARASRDPRRAPMAIYEVHAGSWRRGEGNRWLSWGELADELLPYVTGMGFTHLELMPVNEHPLDASWGYQPIGLFAPTARHGKPADFARFVDRCHAAGIGVLLDWVPAHFPMDEHGLSQFDGTALYEHADPRKGFHPDWKTAVFNFGRREVANYLIANALFWLEHYHVDGLRVDAVASMLYLDYSRKAGEWIPNPQGGNENHEAVAFLRRLNEVVYARHPGAMTIAEESTAWPGVSQPTWSGGLGFGFKWNMGWMNDSLAYVREDPVHRRHHHDRMTFGLVYAYSENFVLPMSHDEVVHGKGSLLARMPGDSWQQFATLRAFYALMWAYPGKKLLFMGQEFAQGREWNFDAALDWHLTGIDWHRGVQSLVRDCNRHYREQPALHGRDCEPSGFRWIVVDDRDNSVFAWLRECEGAPPVVAIANFTPVPRLRYLIGLPLPGRWREILNSDADAYRGSNAGNAGGVVAEAMPAHGLPHSATVTLPPLATLWLVHEGP
ncbi:MAG: 1,4-alpha-glucan branching protein GlgB [Betaproteobacteria bacterium]|nr:1,4-alpha-glucan branching protein GlgB [Betaproteobacteria bacterium]